MIRDQIGRGWLVGLLCCAVITVVFAQENTYFSKAYNLNRNIQYGYSLAQDGGEHVYVGFATFCEFPNDDTSFVSCNGYMKLDVEGEMIWADSLPMGTLGYWPTAFFWKDSLLYHTVYDLEDDDAQLGIAAVNGDNEEVHYRNFDTGVIDEYVAHFMPRPGGFVVAIRKNTWLCSPAASCDTAMVVLLDDDLNPVGEFRVRRDGPAPGIIGLDLLPLPDGTFIGTDTGCSSIAICGGVTRFDAEGNVLWHERLNISAEYSMRGHIPRVAPVPGGDFVVLWRTTLDDQLNSFSETTTFYRMTIDGEIVWTRKIHDHIRRFMELKRLIPTANGDVVACGMAQYRLPPGEDSPLDGALCGYICRMSPSGELLWERRICDLSFGIEEYLNMSFLDVIELPNGDLVMTGDTRLPRPGQVPNITGAIWVVKTDSMGCIEPGCGEVQILTNTEEITVGTSPAPTTLGVFPNPAKNVVNLQLPSSAPSGDYRWLLYNNQGQQVQQAALSSASAQPVPLTDVPAGIYYWQLFLDGLPVESGKLVKD